MIYAVINQKGGVGKSTTAAALWAGLTGKGYKTLAIDLDAQGSLTNTARAENGKGQLTALSVLTREATAQEAIQHTQDGDIIAASRKLAGADKIITDTGKEYQLKEAIQDIKACYDYIIIDTPPALGILTINALTAADSVIIPAFADAYSLQGIDQLMDTITPVKQYCNQALTIAGILLTRHNPRTVLSRDIETYLKDTAKKLNTRVFKATIREAVTIKEAQLKRQSIFKYAPIANVTFDYLNFISEITDQEKQEQQAAALEALSELCLKNDFYDLHTKAFKPEAFITEARKLNILDEYTRAFIKKRHKLTEQALKEAFKEADKRE